MRRRLAPALAGLAVTLLLAACGDGAGNEPAAEVEPADADCVASWNGEKASEIFGRHVYDEHDARQGRVTIERPGPGALTIRANMTCTVVFAVPPTDEEYGDVGLTETRFGWASMRELDRTDQLRMRRLQQEASEAPNVNVFPDGSISPL